METTQNLLEQYKNALDKAAIVATTDHRGNITYVNDLFCAISQYSYDELVGQNHRIINSDHHSDKFWKEFWNTIASGAIWKGEIKNRAKDGSCYWEDTTIVPFLDDSGKVELYLAIRFDITEKKMMDGMLEATADHSKAVGFYYEHATGNLTYSQKTTHILGVSGVVNFEGFFNLIAHPEDQEKIVNNILADFADPKIHQHHFKFRIIRPDNQQTRWLESGGYIARDAQGKTISTTGYFQDITDDVLLKEQTEKLIRSNQELEEFAYVVSHDLKTPLRGINDLALYLEEDLNAYLTSPTANPGVQKNITRLQTQALRMNNIINGLLKYASIGTHALKLQEVKLGQIVMEIAQDLHITNEQLHIATDLPNFTTNEVFLEQVFNNLLSNAVKYHHDKDHLLIKLSHTADTNYYIFTVVDNGPGIESRFHKKIFEFFQTLQPKDSIESTGIGLSIVRKILTIYSCNITIDSELGAGTSFTFNWPKKIYDDALKRRQLMK
jgi:PAS domain S-box-containing protein